MLGHLRKKRAQDGGFTLVELLITIVIIGVLAAVVECMKRFKLQNHCRTWASCEACV